VLFIVRPTKLYKLILLTLIINLSAIFIGGNLKNRLTAKEGKIEKNRLGCF